MVGRPCFLTAQWFYLYLDGFERSITSYWLRSSDSLFAFPEKQAFFSLLPEPMFPSSLYIEVSVCISLIQPVTSVTNTVPPAAPRLLFHVTPRSERCSSFLIFFLSLISLNFTVSLQRNLSSSSLKPPKKPLTASLRVIST